MAYITINDANIFYETYGEDRPGRAPILLIHGSTVDGRTDWGRIAPALAARYKVLVPDCRGHGHSNNPRMTYSFAEMADDAAAFVRALGYARAHVIGHSNGGNVALVTLMEHPDVIQTCIPQAANAYITRYLVEREPVYFDPARIEREEPDWMNEMIRLHEETNGAGYWRELCLLSMKETMSEPNYSPADLARVTKPVLVIMGAQDGSNARDEHAQYIANHIPNAQMWIPEATGHHAHLERREEWVERVLGFLEGRG
ncbi:MAG: alpha/beta hydrolase [Chloroflexota bacterium]